MTGLDLSTLELFILAAGALGLGILMLIRGGEWTIDSAIYIAGRLGISPVIVGFTIVAFGTSLPELIVSVNANLQDSPGIVIGNVIGSNVANILMVGGAIMLLQPPLMIGSRKDLTPDLIAMMGATALLTGIALSHDAIGQAMGLFMVIALMAYSFYQYKTVASDKDLPPMEDDGTHGTARGAFAFLLLGLICIALGAEFLVRGTKVAAFIVGVPESVVSLSVIAIGTSLPELSTCLIAARRGESGLILGNIIGSNVFNIMMICGVTALFKPIDLTLIAPQVFAFDIWVTTAVSAAFTALLLVFRKMGRMTGGLFLTLYVAYIAIAYSISYLPEGSLP